jgi:hypothetical protein
VRWQRRRARQRSTSREARKSLNVERYMHFALRDAQLAQPGAGQTLFHFFGLTRADYSRKPAYDVFRGLVNELG